MLMEPAEGYPDGKSNASLEAAFLFLGNSENCIMIEG
jgi:hypothetical protein